MANKVLKSFRDKRNKDKLYKVGDAYESRDSKRVAFLVEEGFVEEDKKSSNDKKGKSGKKAGE